jgi:alpha/beta superfamily hydrolase
MSFGSPTAAGVATAAAIALNITMALAAAAGAIAAAADASLTNESDDLFLRDCPIKPLLVALENVTQLRASETQPRHHVSFSKFSHT